MAVIYDFKLLKNKMYMKRKFTYENYIKMKKTFMQRQLAVKIFLFFYASLYT